MTTLHLDELLTSLEDFQTIKIIITKDECEKSYHIPRGVLTTASPWFCKALASSHFCEGQSGTLRFPDTDPEVVEQVIFWLLRGSLPKSVFSEGYIDATPSKADAIDRKLFREIEARQLIDVRIWTFAEEHMLPQLQELAMKRLYELLKSQYPSIGTIREAYATSPEKSMLRKVMMFETVAGWRNKIGEGRESLPGYTPRDLENFAKEADGFMEDFARVAGRFMPEMKETEGAAVFKVENFLEGQWDSGVRADRARAFGALRLHYGV